MLWAFRLVVCYAVLFWAGSELRLAQTPPVPQPDPKACAASERLPPVGRQSSSQGGDVSDKLARTDGVLCPPAGVDPAIMTPPPGGGRTPVIPPPGSPGGDRSVQPK